MLFVDNIERHKQELARGGCPFGGLCAELHKKGGALAKQSAELYTEPMGWIDEQFRAAGHEKDSRALAAHLFCAF